MAVNGTISKTTFTDTITAGTTLIKAVHLNEINNAITTLNNLKGNVNNCDCSVCTSNCCQSCQKTTCQSQCKCDDCSSSCH